MSTIQTYLGADMAWMSDIKSLEQTSHDIHIKMQGDNHKSKRDVETLPGTLYRLENIVWNTWYSTSGPTTTNKEQYELSQEEYTVMRQGLDELKSRVEELERKLDAQGVPYTPGRIDWKGE